MTLEEFRAYSPVFESDLYDAISLEKCVERRTSAGGASSVNITAQLDYLRGITG